jgi:replicative DNA helicase
MADALTRTLQENLITLLCYDDEQGKIVANMLNIELMEGDYRMIAERAIEYWRQYEVAPSDHTADLFANELEDKHNRRGNTIRRLLRAMIALSETVNTKYVMNQLRDHTRLQRFKSAIVESAEKINNIEQLALPEIEELWSNLLRTREMDFMAGTRLNDISKVLARLKELETDFRIGIPELDRRHIVPQRGKLLLIGGAAGRGKTWALIHIGKQALMDRKKVIHFSCEIDEEEVIGRYWQSIFSVSKRREPIDITEFEVSADELTGFERKAYKPTFAIEDDTAGMELNSHWEHMGAKGKNLIVKRFKPNELTANAIRAYLDTLEMVEGFVPDMMIFDYLGLMKKDPKNIRGSMSINCEELRGICIDRNLAGVTAHQLSKAGELAVIAKGTHLAEDWSIMGTCDTVITYSCTDLEFEYGLGRMYVAKARSDQDRFAIVITQSYKVGQFCLESMYLHRDYKALFNDFAGVEETSDDDDDESETDE